MYVGQNVRRRDALAKVVGAAHYVDDLVFPGMLHGVTVRSTVPHARILGITYDPAFDWSDIVRVDHRDIPGENVVASFKDDQPCLAADRVNHLYEPVLLLAAADLDRVRAAAQHVVIEYEELPAAFTMEDALKGEVHVGGDEQNVHDRIHMRQGDVDAAFAAADHIVKGDYRTGYQEQLYLETQGMVALPVEGGGVKLYASCQCPYFIQRALRLALAMDDSQIETVQAVTGGAFGGKEEYPSIMAAHVALLALKAGAPVKLIYDRQEDLQATTKRHPAAIHLEHAVAADGTILAVRGTFDIDGGAYSTLSKVVLSRGLIHLPGPYRIPAVDIMARVVATHTVPNGAFRGFGAPQATYAYETQMNRVAEACGLDPLAVRLHNRLRDGDATATGMVLDSISLQRCAERVLEASNYIEIRRQLLESPDPGPVKRGIGLSFFLHGAGFTGSGEARIKGKGAVTIEPGGRFRVRVATVEMGQGMRTTLAQIVADTLEVPLDRVFFGATSTHEVPDSGPTVASRTAMVVGKVVHEAALRLRADLEQFGSDVGLEGADLPTLAEAHLEQRGPLAGEWTYALPPGIEWDEERHSGDAYPTYSWAAEVVEVRVDTDTGEVSIDRIVSATDVGRALHPRIVVGQIEGGTLQGVGFAYGESTTLRGGQLLNDRLATYIIPTIQDAPRQETHVLEDEFDYGPFGAKGVGEMPLDGVAPAVAAAVELAAGVRLDTVPITPERILQLCEQRDAEAEVQR